MNLAQAKRELKAAADPKIATIYARRAPEIKPIGVRFADLDRIAKAAGPDHALSLKLWNADIVEARLLAAKIEVPGQMTRSQITSQLKDLDNPSIADLWTAKVYRTPWAQTLMRQWTKRRAEYTRRCGFTLVYAFAADPDSAITDDELFGYLDQIEAEVHDSANWAREAMNMAPIAIGLRSSALKKRALAATRAYGKVDVFHGDKTNCKVWNAYDALRDPKVRVKVPA